MASAPVAATPTHLWVVGILSLLWNAFGAADYTMTELGSSAWFEMMGLGAEELAWTQSFPAWVVACWAVGVWGSVAGSLLLLARSRHAATAFLLALIGAAASFAYQFTAAGKPASMAGGGSGRDASRDHDPDRGAVVLCPAPGGSGCAALISDVAR